MSDIVERLRNQSILDVWHPMMLEAAAEILRLRAENEKLRAALNDIDGMATTICMKNEAGYPIHIGSVMDIYMAARRAAAAAIRETGDE